MGRRVNYSGLVVAGIGFFLTRFTVTLAIYDDPVRFYFAGIVPLVLGLGLAAFGVALAVADVRAAVARTTALWCVIGLGTMSVLVVLTLVGSTAGDLADLPTLRSRAYLSNFMIGGSVGGTLTGLYASRTERQRGEIRDQANRLQVLNRLLRHEIINAVAVIKGWITQVGPNEAKATRVIAERAEAIERTIEDVKYLARSTGTEGLSSARVDLRPCLEDSVETVTARHPSADVTIADCPTDLSVRATDRLGLVFTHLLENSVEHGEDPRPELHVSTTPTQVRVSVRDRGPGLPASQRALLETGAIQEYDDPKTGFGLNVARLLVEDFGGDIETAVDSTGTTVTVVLERAAVEHDTRPPLPTGAEGVRPTIPHLLVTTAAALLAGVFYGLASELLGGSIAGIGVFYGTESLVVGWFTHEFHSVVFAFVFAGLVSLAPERYRGNPLAYVAIGAGWAFTLWVIAAGVIAPVWLRLLGIPAGVPNFSGYLLVSHLAWGISLGALTAWGYRVVVPRISPVVDRWSRLPV